MTVETGATQGPVSDEKQYAFDVTKAVNYIVDDTKNRYFRAIKLFELHVAIRLADGYPSTNKEDLNRRSSSRSPFLVGVSKGKMRQARLFATIKLLEHLQRLMKEDWGDSSLDILA